MSAGPSGKSDKNPRKKSFMDKYREYLEQQKSATSAAKKEEPLQKKAGIGKETPAEDAGAETPEEAEVAPKKKTREEKQKEHLVRIEKTLIACGLGIATGIIAFLVISPSQIEGLNSYTILALLIMISGIVVQRHIFMLLRLGSQKMGAKDWLYQGFMTFAFWFITWTLLLTQGA